MTPREAFAAQAEYCRALGSPFMAQLMGLASERLTEDSPVGAALLNWSGDPSPTADGLPLRFAGALHALRLAGLALDGVYPPHQVDDDTLWTAVLGAMADHAPRILAALQSAPQTNEVRRSAAILPALATLTTLTDMPIALYELGASGGLNLRADRFAIATPAGVIGDPESGARHAPEWTGAPPPTRLPRITARGGVDLSPIDPTQETGRLRLLSYLWPDQPERLERTEAAIALARAHPARMIAGDAAEGLARLFDEHPEGARAVVFHTIAWQYFPEATQSRAEEIMASAPFPVSRIALEAEGRENALIRLWPEASGAPLALGRAGFHAEWIAWDGLSDTAL